VVPLEIDDAIVLVSDRPATTSAELLARAVSHLTGERSEEVAVHHLCPHCGGDDHGQPFVGGAAATTRACVVSFSRTAGFEVAVARAGGSVGIDVESVSRISSHSVDDVLLHPEERKQMHRLANDAAVRYRARLWVAKEATLKSTGDGLRTDIREIHVEIDGQRGFLESWPSALALRELRVTFFDVSADVAGAVAIR
jgi:phosphopantetheinyl transferase